MPYIPSDEEINVFITPGTYRVKITLVLDTDKDGNKKVDKHGDEFWGFCVAVQDETGFYGEQVWDNLVFSANNPSQMRRTKDILEKFGIDTSKGIDVKQEQLKDKQAKADIYIDEYKGDKKNKVQFFGGYHKLEGEPVETKGDIPY